jgi:hypothetical protein
LRSAIESERDLISRLKDKINNEHLKLLLQSAPSLAFALIGFLDPKANGTDMNSCGIESLARPGREIP